MASLAELLRDPRFRQDVGNNARDFLQSASNTAASNVTAPVDGLAWLLRQAGVPVPQSPIGGSDWANNAGLMAEPKNKNSLASLLGEAAGNIAPIAGYAKAPQIAGGLLKADEALQPVASRMLDKYMEKIGGKLNATVYHGSPHKFDKFDASKIGTGEGAQAYGHGLYLADEKAVASGYQSKLTDDAFKYKAMNDAKMRLNEKLAQRVEASDPARAAAFRAEVASLGEPGGSLYKVDLPDSAIAKMLDWDKPFSNQSESIRGAEALKGFLPDETGADIYRVLSKELAGGSQFAKGKNDVAADVLRKQGIPGIRYLDGGSRGAGQGSSNYVVFPGNESLLKILSRNGQNLP